MRNALPALLFSFGAIWLMHNLGWIPDADWLRIVAPAIIGIVLFVLNGVTRTTIVVSPILLLVSLMQYLHDFYAIERKLMMPVLLMVAGLLMVVARLPSFAGRERRTDSNKQRSVKPDAHSSSRTSTSSGEQGD